MFLKKLTLILMLITLCAAVPAYAQDSSEAENQVLFIGTVTDIPDEFVGLAIDGEAATFYICDGQADKGTVSIAEWFVGSVADNLIDITAPSGNRVEISIADGIATGKLTFADGTVKEFVMALADGEASLFRSDFSIGELDYIGGWLILADGTVRGAVFVPATSNLFAASFEGFALRQLDPIN